MKKLFTILTAVLLAANVFAQAPEKMSYQAVIRNSENNLVSNSISLTASNGTITKNNYITVAMNGSGAGLTDIDGNTYTSVIIGGKEWMAENLKVTHYPNGDPIPLVTDNTAWDNLGNNNTDDAYCYYNNDVNSIYGALYTYAAAIGDNWEKDLVENQGVCPDGWHLPSDAEWTELTDYLGGEAVAGGKLKEAGTTHWIAPNAGATNESGFTALPGGGRVGNYGTFFGLGYNGYWWSVTQGNNSKAWRRSLYCRNSVVSRYFSNKSPGFSVRCVRD